VRDYPRADQWRGGAATVLRGAFPSNHTEIEASRLWPSLHIQAVDHGLATGEAPTDWRMLLQVSSDSERLGTKFGDGGTLAFAIPADDLAAGSFDHVQAFTDSL
jgi:hypothetical protein